MTVMSQADAALWEAYRRTTYYAGDVERPRRFALRIGGEHPEWDRWLADHGAHEWAYITAFNPQSQPCSAAENARRQQRLEERLRELGIAYLKGEGVADDGRWPAESSVLAYGVDVETATTLGRHFEQVAIVAGRSGEPARLIACGPDPAFIAEP